jgi:hypothetical protein
VLPDLDEPKIHTRRSSASARENTRTIVVLPGGTVRHAGGLNAFRCVPVPPLPFVA